jgi:ribosomal protein L11 methyltransferase
MYSVRLVFKESEREQLIAELWGLGTAGLTEYDDSLVAFFEERVDDPALARFQPRWQQTADEDWVAVSREGWEPFFIGSRLFVVPEWRDDPAPEGRVRLEVFAGMASGSGYSTPTRLALEAIDGFLSPGATFLDVGTGSGILTAAAKMLGAGNCVACEIDTDAATIAARNLGGRASVFVGSPRSLRSGIASMIAANLNASALTSIASELVRVGTPDFKLIVSGFSTREETEMIRLFQGCVMTVQAILEREGWTCLVLVCASE